MNQLYNFRAYIYDLIYSKKDFALEVSMINELIQKYKKSKGKELLDVGCGSGNHLIHLQKDYTCTGIDINPGILAIARKKLPGIDFIEVDMASFSFQKKFDIIICLFGTLGYALTLKNMQRTLLNFSHHLNKDGIVIIDPWFSPEKYEVGSPHLTTFSSPDIKIARSDVFERKKNQSIIDMHFLVAERNKKVEHFIDRHVLGLFTPKEILNAITNAQFSKIHLEEKIPGMRDIYIGIKK